MRETDTGLHEKALQRAEEKASAELAAQQSKDAARKRLIGAYVLGGLGVWQVMVRDVQPPMLYLWVGVMLLAFGLANVEQILTAFGKR